MELLILATSTVITIDDPSTDLDKLEEVLNNNHHDNDFILDINVTTQEMYDKVKKMKLNFMRRIHLRDPNIVRLYGLPIKNTQ